jgi:hypothetical protein
MAEDVFVLNDHRSYAPRMPEMNIGTTGGHVELVPNSRVEISDAPANPSTTYFHDYFTLSRSRPRLNVCNDWVGITSP